MTEKIVERIRRFAPLSSRSREWDFLMLGPGRPQHWHEIEDDFRVLIIADPGAGKTFEALTRARKIKERGRYAFFILADHRLGSRFEVLPRMIALQLEPLSAVTAAMRFDATKMRDGARMPGA